VVHRGDTEQPNQRPDRGNVVPGIERVTAVYLDCRIASFDARLRGEQLGHAASWADRLAAVEPLRRTVEDGSGSFEMRLGAGETVLDPLIGPDRAPERRALARVGDRLAERV